jgi:Protein of unknown function (DUF3800)
MSAPVAIDFWEFTCGWNYHRKDMVTMIWAYFDESGEHDGETGQLRNLTIAGGVASCNSWAKLSLEWNNALVAEGLESFHMKDFEAYQPPFDWYLDADRQERDHYRHRKFLNHLLDIIIAHIPSAVAFNRHPVKSSRILRDTYAECFEDCLGQIVKWVSPEHNSPIHLVFAHHDEHKAARKEAVAEFINFGERISSCSVARPLQFLPLQAADLIAYELSRSQRENCPERYPLKRLRTEMQYCSLFTSSRDVLADSNNPS